MVIFILQKSSQAFGGFAKFLSLYFTTFPPLTPFLLWHGLIHFSYCCINLIVNAFMHITLDLMCHLATEVMNSCMCGSVTQSCATLHDLMYYSPPGSSVFGFPRQEYWSGLPFLPLGDLPDPGIELVSTASPAPQIHYCWATKGAIIM